MKKSIALSVIAFLLVTSGHTQEMKLDDVIGAYC